MLHIFKHLKRLEAGLLCLALVGVSVITPVTGVSAEKGSKLEGRDLLKLSIDYCSKMEDTKYTEDTYQAFQKELENAKKVYNDASKDDLEYRDERDALEKVKAAMTFKPVEDSGNPRPFTELSVEDMVADMGAGFNLGNTMEGHTGLVPNETLWQNVKTTKAFIKHVHDQGFNTVRIPVTWGSMIKEDYSIDEKWMSRVQDIVDYCISQDMYCIINVHHDGAEQTGWLRVAADDIDTVYEKFEGVWRSIATQFKDYDEHLIFESMNEIVGDGSYPNSEAHDVKVIMNLNQIFTNVVRNTGSNNAKRWLLVPAKYTNIDATTNPANAFEIPTDTVKDRIFVSVHHYDMSLGLTPSMSGTTFSETTMEILGNTMQKMMDSFTSKGIPVILGEYGAINKNNSADRAYFCEGITRMCQVTGKMVACYWDQGWYDRTQEPADYSFTLFDRETGEDIDTTVTDGILRGTFLSGNAKKCSEVVKDIKKDVKVVPASVINLDKTALDMVVGDKETVKTSLEPKENNDIILWKTDDETVATVYNGKIRAKGVGTTTITATAKDGKIENKVTVTVSAKGSTNPVTEIKTEKDSYEVEKDGYVFLNETVTPENTDATVSYRSSDESVATVSSLGKVVGVGSGTAMITIASSSGLTKTVKVVCKGEESTDIINVTLNAYYNDNDNNYFGEEVGEKLEISKDGQYTATFDCAKDLSDAAKKAGVKGLNNLTAIYLKDDDVTKGKISTSKVTACDITYNKITVDGKEIPITKTEKKSALKSSGIFDTNDPINSWDGSVVEEVEVDGNHSLNFKGIDNPQKVEVVFTLSGLTFKGGDKNKETETKIESVAVDGADRVEIAKADETAQLSVVVSPATEKANVSFVSSDESIVAVAATSVETGADGKAVVTVTGKKAGTATVTAYAKDGLKAEFTVTVAGETKDEAVAVTTTNKESSNNNTIYIVIAVVAVVLIACGVVLVVRKKSRK